MPTAEIVAIGSELLLGQIIDTNSAWLADRLSKLGVDLYHKTVVGDNHVRMVEVIDKALDRSDVVITSGGLGPTQDDITRRIGPGNGSFYGGYAYGVAGSFYATLFCVDGAENSS